MGLIPETQVKHQVVEKKDATPLSAVDDAIHRLLTQRPGTAHQPSFEDLLTEMDPEDFKAVQRLKEAIESRG